jgi:CheY-like chemotaxis protein
MNNSNYKPASILLVDDDDIDAESVKRALNKLKVGNTLVRARDGIEALELLDAGTISEPYLILLDINMPRMNGIEFLHAIRNNPDHSHAVVFILTTSKADEDKIAAYKEHIAGYILKLTLDEGFNDLVSMLDHYWRIVELPITDRN